ncbi:MAG TPA: hypothetical protein VIL85_29295 [Thermomicrobiales bacterium]
MGFLGPNGAGKTTTLRILFDSLYPTIGLDVTTQRRIGAVNSEYNRWHGIARRSCSSATTCRC